MVVALSSEPILLGKLSFIFLLCSQAFKGVLVGWCVMLSPRVCADSLCPWFIRTLFCHTANITWQCTSCFPGGQFSISSFPLATRRQCSTSYHSLEDPDLFQTPDSLVILVSASWEVQWKDNFVCLVTCKYIFRTWMMFIIVFYSLGKHRSSNIIMPIRYE